MLAEQQVPFTDGKLIKLGLTASADEICAEKINLFTTFRFGEQKRTWRAVSNQLKVKADYFLGFDELIDVIDTTQVVLFIQGVNAIQWHWNDGGLVSVNTLNEQNIFKEVEETLTQYNPK